MKAGTLSIDRDFAPTALGLVVIFMSVSDDASCQPARLSRESVAAADDLALLRLKSSMLMLTVVGKSDELWIVMLNEISQNEAKKS